MATNDEILAKVAEAQSLALTPQQIVLMCDRAIGEFFQGKPTVSYTIQGRSFTFASLETTRGLRDYYSNIAAAGASQYIMQPSEF